VKKKGFIALIVIVLIVAGLSACKKKDDLTKVQLTEVAHSIFYSPQYVALELGYFEDEGLDVELVNGLGADKTMTAVFYILRAENVL